MISGKNLYLRHITFGNWQMTLVETFLHLQQEICLADKWFKDEHAVM